MKVSQLALDYHSSKLALTSSSSKNPCLHGKAETSPSQVTGPSLARGGQLSTTSSPELGGLLQAEPLYHCFLQHVYFNVLRSCVFLYSVVPNASPNRGSPPRLDGTFLRASKSSQSILFSHLSVRFYRSGSVCATGVFGSLSHARAKEKIPSRTNLGIHVMGLVFFLLSSQTF